MFRATLPGSALKLFDNDFLIDQDIWPSVDWMFTRRYDSSIKQEEVSNELNTIGVKAFQTNEDSCSMRFSAIFLGVWTLLSLPGSDLMSKEGTLRMTWLSH